MLTVVHVCHANAEIDSSLCAALRDARLSPFDSKKALKALTMRLFATLRSSNVIAAPTVLRVSSLSVRALFSMLANVGLVA